jgi:hypothetical protein
MIVHAQNVESSCSCLGEVDAAMPRGDPLPRRPHGPLGIIRPDNIINDLVYLSGIHQLKIMIMMR